MTKGISHEDVIICASADLAADFLIASAVEVHAADGRVKTEFKLLPIGTFTLRDGRGPFVIRDLAHAQQVVRDSLIYAGAQDLFIDYDHQLIFSAIAGVGGRAPAAGWIKGLEARADGIWVKPVEWTAAARQELEDRVYRYISPLFRATKDGLVTVLINAGLVNQPAIDGLGAIAASQNPKEKPMDLTALAASLGLPATATLEQCIAASTALSGQAATLRTTLGLDATGDLIAAATTLKAAKPAAGEGEIVVSASIFNEMTARLGVLEGVNIAASVDAAIVAGKLTPAQRDWATKLGTKNPDDLASYLAVAVPVAAATNLNGGGAVVDPANGLTADELVAASTAGLTPEEFIAAKAAYPKEA